MFRAVHCMLKCTETRNATLDILEKLLVVNSKKVQLVTDDHFLSTDGLLFNLLYVLQQLNSKVKLASVSYNTLLIVIVL